ncbi:MAG: UvrD-helicase domain-containing protein [Deltaproteobacteria bacterium]|jgi:DNA helicase-2/ATP-dependent DNA helicase PcrA|nr:UvrD-helicase domain-containing protein [Deltaproteobacteria bacterium]
MPKIFADLHIHSRYSRATSKSLTPENLHLWGAFKGLDLLGTGDMTHPGWLDELDSKLTLDDEGLYALKGVQGGPRFVPTGEISAIYKQEGRTRKIHLVVVAPDLSAARRFSQNLGRVGNVKSDGRPILGLSARNLLAIALDSDPRMEVIPAHIWTPWFSLFGSKSGFDSLTDCFGDLSGHIRALETGLSSDPAMNRLVSALDGYALVSSSDAHSPEKLGREATVFDGPLTFENLRQAIRGGSNLIGTVEFFPEEGKYHLDGHAQCGPALTPAQTAEAGGLCPVCGKPLTVGVLSRVYELADRTEPPPEILKPDWHILPLAELLGQVLDRSPNTQVVRQAFDRIVAEFGSEFRLLLQVPLDDIKSFAGPVLAKGIEKMRLGQVEAQGGYDGVFGRITVLSRSERLELGGQPLLFATGTRAGRPRKLNQPAPASDVASVSTLGGGPSPSPKVIRRSGSILSELTDEQVQAVTFSGGDLAVIAGPGSGKTMVMVRRAAYLISKGLGPILVTTYTRKAAETLETRLTEILGDKSPQVTVSTLHALALRAAEKNVPGFSLGSDDIFNHTAKEAAKHTDLSPRRFKNFISLIKNSLTPVNQISEPRLKSGFEQYLRVLTFNRLWDYDDLIIEALKTDWSGRFKAVLADEFQDFSPAQLQLLLSVAKNSSLTVIGDPDQSIYGFRGAISDIFDRLSSDRAHLTRLYLTRNFRSQPTICRLADGVRGGEGPPRVPARRVLPEKIGRQVFPNPAAEAAWVVSRIKSHLGVLDLGPGGSSREDMEVMEALALSDIAVIFRIRHQSLEFTKKLDEAGLRWQEAGEEETTSADGLDFKADKINLLTMHSAKGLEFRLVFVVGLEDRLCPLHLEAEPDRSEERRLFYVAVTRARDRLYLTRSENRFIFGQKLDGTRSPFWDLVNPADCRDFRSRWTASRSKLTLPRLF